MEVRTDTDYDRPLPDMDGVSETYWKAAAEGRLLIQRCTNCDKHQFYPRGLCIRCGGEPEWVEASGKGTEYTFTMIRQYHAPPFKEKLPYIVAIIELEESVRVMGNITDCDVDAVSTGMPVEAYAVKVEEEGIGVPFWRLA